MGLSIRVSGGIIKRMVQEHFGTPAETYTSVSFLTTKHTALESTYTKTAADMKVIGSMMSNKAKERKSGLMEHNMLAITKTE